MAQLNDLLYSHLGYSIDYYLIPSLHFAWPRLVSRNHSLVFRLFVRIVKEILVGGRDGSYS